LLLLFIKNSKKHGVTEFSIDLYYNYSIVWYFCQEKTHISAGFCNSLYKV